MPTTAKRPEIGIIFSVHVSTDTRIKDIPNTIITFMLFLIYLPLLLAFSKNIPIQIPAALPKTTPSIMEIGIPIKSYTFAVPPCAIPVKAEKRTITKISSHDAPAIISWGMLFFVPYPLSISIDILGMTTAGETADITAPITAASIFVMPKI